MAETLNYCVHRTQASVELPHSMNAVTRQGLSISFLIQQGVSLYHKLPFVRQRPLPQMGIKSLRSRD
ncbi:hypothetical protein PGTDC60_1956 [Porphyromonas gingivalis TDC60]|nr:hypothetical protein PGTDC60_1956 [Porphyromonas gingivalis TDC60]